MSAKSLELTCALLRLSECAWRRKLCVLFVTRGPVNSGLKLPTIGNRAHQSIMPPKVTMAPPKPSVRFSDRSVTPMGTTRVYVCVICYKGACQSRP